MTKNVAYKQCVCDICKREATIDQSCTLPEGWGRLRLDMLLSLDVCGNCADKITKHVENMIQHYREEREQE